MSPPRRRLLVVAGALACGVLVLHLAAAARLARTGVLHEWDVLFNADPAVYTKSYTTGLNTFRWGGRSFVHPNVTNVLYPVVTAVAATIHAARPAVSEVLAARHIADLVSPLSSAATAAVLLIAFTEFGLGVLDATLLALVQVASFSSLIFGSIPESYCLTGFAMAILFLMAIRTARDPESRAARGQAWVVPGTVLASITITNLIPFALVAAIVRRRRTSTLAAATWAAAVTAAALVTTAGLYSLGAKLSAHTQAFTPFASGQINERHGFDLQESLVEFPLAMANTIAPPVPILAPGDTTLRQTMRFTITYHAPPSDIPGQWWRAVLTLAVLAAAVACARSIAPWQRTVFGAAALVVAFNWLLHTFYGTEYFLYSQHWDIALVVMLAALVAIPGRRRHLARGLLALCLVLCAWNSVYVWRATVHFLDSSSDTASDPVESASDRLANAHRAAGTPQLTDMTSDVLVRKDVRLGIVTPICWGVTVIVL